MGGEAEAVCRNRSVRERAVKRALVTGAFGFVGRHVALALAREGFDVAGIGHGDWAMAGVSGRASDWGISAWHSADVDTASLVEHGGTPDLIVHCAGSGSVPYSLERPREDFVRTVDATLAVADFIRLQAPAARLVLPSSAATYGKVEAMPIGIDAPLRPLSPYGVHKKVAEDLVRSYCAHFGLNAAIVRLFSVYGVGLRKQLLWDACRKFADGNPQFGGDGQETRDWLHVEDAAGLMVAAAATASTLCPTYNGGTGAGVPVQQVVTRLAARLGGPEPRFTGVTRPGDPRDFRADVAEALAIGWRPRRALDEGLDEYADWFAQGAA